MRYRVHALIEVDAASDVGARRKAGHIVATWSPGGRGVAELEMLPFPDLLVDGFHVACGHCGKEDGLVHQEMVLEDNDVVAYEPLPNPDDERCVLLIRGDSSDGEGGYARGIYCRTCKGSSRIPDGLDVEWT